MKKDTFRVILMAIISVALLATISLYGYMVISKREVDLGSSIAFIIPLLIVVFMAFFITRRYRDIKQGMPFEDERSKRIMTQAAAKAFYVTLYWLLAISWFEEFFAGMFGVEHLDAGKTVGGGIAGMALAWFAFWFYYNKKLV